MSPHDHEIFGNPNDDTDMHEIEFSRSGCCFWFPCCYSKGAFPFGSTRWERIRTDEYQNTEPWWTRGWKRIREWSELSAGPKWKTFIRTFRKKHNGLVLCVGGGEVARQPKFHYDPLSYALNFDDGPGQNGYYMDEDMVSRDFSSRFASVPAFATFSPADAGKEAPLIK